MVIEDEKDVPLSIPHHLNVCRKDNTELLRHKITVAAFLNTSSEKLVEKMSFSKVYLPNDKEKDFKTVLPEIEKSEYLIFFGQKPLIKKVFIELVANKLDESLKTNFDHKNLESEFKKNNVQFQESFSPGNSFCNAVYYKTLEYVKLNNLSCKVLFLHVPYLNYIDDIQTYSFQIEKAIRGIISNNTTLPTPP